MSKFKRDIDRYKKYCCGCGLCHSVNDTEYIFDNNFYRPQLTEQDLDFCSRVCPANGRHVKNISNDYPWGQYKSVALTWSNDDVLRYKASSGGTISTIAIYLLESRTVDGVIQIKPNSSNQILTDVCVSTSREEIIANVGSRYTASYPLININKIVEAGKKYAFVGKPCDVISLKNYFELNSALKEQIIITISFFCAGMPSLDANRKLLKELKSSEENCAFLSYRGNGWPGYATAVNKDGSQYSISYNDSLGLILGRDINKYCRFCMDGIGEQADISCGDAWHLGEDGTPDFSESSGRNITFGRTEVGDSVLKACYHNGCLHSEAYNLLELPLIQNYQYTRKSQVYSRMIGLILCGKLIPFYSLKRLREISKSVPAKNRIRIILGTIKRVFEGKM